MWNAFNNHDESESSYGVAVIVIWLKAKFILKIINGLQKIPAKIVVDSIQISKTLEVKKQK